MPNKNSARELLEGLYGEGWDNCIRVADDIAIEGSGDRAIDTCLTALHTLIVGEMEKLQKENPIRDYEDNEGLIHNQALSDCLKAVDKIFKGEVKDEK